jgi:hypothetical protein
MLLLQCSLLLPIPGEACVVSGSGLVSDNGPAPQEAPGHKVSERMVMNISAQEPYPPGLMRGGNKVLKVWIYNKSTVHPSG